MKPRIAKRLVEVLKSGNFKKGEGALCELSDNGSYSFCCLGVLSELYNYEQKLKHKKQLPISYDAARIENHDGSITYDGPIEYEGEDGGCPWRVAKWADLDSKTEQKLIELNDHNDTWHEVIKELKTHYNGVKNA